MPSPFIVSSDVQAAREARATRRAWADGELKRVRRGTYLFGDDWAALDRRSQHIATVCAQLRRLSAPVIVSHASAAALHGFPVLDSWPDEVHVYDPRRSRGQRTSTLVRHVSNPLPAAVVARGVTCTTPVRTAVDVGLAGFIPALLAFDFGLGARLFTGSDLEAEVASRTRRPGIDGVRRAAEAASPHSGSPAESISRATILELGFPSPELQKRFANPRGGSYFVDFWWAEAGIIGEFDGREKYLDPALRGMRSLERVVLDEKERADDLRAHPEVTNLVRWNYATARNPHRLAAVLEAAGLHRLSG